LYEGFLLFPYSKSALKNQLPFQFGVIMPQGYSDASEPASVRAQFVCLLRENEARVEGALRFLHIAEDPVAREVPFAFSLAPNASRVPFELGDLRGEAGIHTDLQGESVRVTIELRNLAVINANAGRNDALRFAFVSAHMLLEAFGAEFSSMVDAPQEAAGAVAQCTNDRMFPVLVGDEGASRQTSTMLLVSPIILYDFPKIANASRARTFDGTEIDELLMLSVASLTDEEKRNARAAHPYVRELVERAEALDAQTQATLHGELTGGAPRAGDERVTIAGVEVGPGSRVRVLPKGRADVWDDLVRGMTARVNAVHTDFEGKRYIGVVFDADPASDMHEWYGRSFFYGADEVEPLA
jgi:hypothetical protein